MSWPDTSPRWFDTTYDLRDGIKYARPRAQMPQLTLHDREGRTTFNAWTYEHPIVTLGRRHKGGSDSVDLPIDHLRQILAHFDLWVAMTRDHEDVTLRVPDGG